MMARRTFPPRRLNPRHQQLQQELVIALRRLVPLIWLPVGRYHPASEGEQERLYRTRRHSPTLESVDARLRVLGQQLSEYRALVERRASRRYEDFVGRVLEAMLYSERFDSVGALRAATPFNDEDRRDLMQVFEEVGLASDTINEKVRAHFQRTDEAHKSLHATSEGARVREEDLVIIPLIERTRSLVASARTLGTERDETFSAIRRYQEGINRFLRDKEVTVQDDGKLTITYTGSRPSPQNQFSFGQLSSGEKQILTLLTAALIEADTPVVYVADEPELSLHVEWQEKLLRSLVELGGDMQIIVATHSPDIVGPFHDNVVELPRG